MKFKVKCTEKSIKNLNQVRLVEKIGKSIPLLPSAFCVPTSFRRHSNQLLFSRTMDQKSKTRSRDAKSGKNACAIFLSQTALTFGLQARIACATLLIFGMSTFCATVLLGVSKKLDSPKNCGFTSFEKLKNVCAESLALKWTQHISLLFLHFFRWIKGSK